MNAYQTRRRPRHWLVDEARAAGIVVTLNAHGGLHFRGPTIALGVAWQLVRVAQPRMIAVLTEERTIRDAARARSETLSRREQNCVMWYATAEPGFRCPRCSRFLEDCDLIDELQEGPDASCAP